MNMETSVVRAGDAGAAVGFLVHFYDFFYGDFSG